MASLPPGVPSEPITQAAENPLKLQYFSGKCFHPICYLVTHPPHGFVGDGNLQIGTKYTVTANNIADTAATPNQTSTQTKFYSLGELNLKTLKASGL